MKPIFAFLVASGLCGCAGVDEIRRSSLTTFEPMEDGSFKMSAADPAGVLFSVDELAPKWAAEYVSENKLCQNGYYIHELRRILVSRNFDGSENYKRNYIIRCK